MQTIDARGFPCPQPVILTRNAMQESGDVITIVDDDIAQRNVTRMAQKAGSTVEAKVKDDGIYLHIRGGQAEDIDDEDLSCDVKLESGPLVLSVSSEHMGSGEHEELGQILMRGFFHTLGEVRPLPDKIVFYNSGVRLAVQGSPVLEDVLALEEKGVDILACGTCLGYYELKDLLAVGEISNMYTIAETLLGAAKIVTP